MSIYREELVRHKERKHDPENLRANPPRKRKKRPVRVMTKWHKRAYCIHLCESVEAANAWIDKQRRSRWLDSAVCSTSAPKMDYWIETNERK